MGVQYKSFVVLGALLLVLPGMALAASKLTLDKADIDPLDKESLRRGAQYFANYCFNCHSIQFMRYSRIAKDLQLTEDEVSSMMIFTGAKVGDPMNVALLPDDAKRWFGTTPPDLSVVSRSRGVDWIYTYLRSFYRDDSRPWGVNNAVFKDVAMPHVLWELQGLQEAVYGSVTTPDGVEHKVIAGLNLVQKGQLAAKDYDAVVRDIVNFLAYVGEPTKNTRLALGKWVLIFLAMYFVVLVFLKKEYWKDIK
ncbi:MAG: cytochrome c1 [Gammaproteobacteria bacterium]|nr:cytochrome c1 [Gammaproteobacteria bacterium]MDH5803280.1 cytochrome c1 [Gammaproteobacteria bacterium]